MARVSGNLFTAIDQPDISGNLLDECWDMLQPPPVFRTCHKPLSYYADTPETQALMKEFGSHLQNLTQEEKYQAISAIGIFLWKLSAEAEEEAATEVDDEDDFDFEEEESQIDITFDNVCQLTLSPDVYRFTQMLYHVEPEMLAAMLPAIAFYAAEDAAQ
jgi:hypothetical protein